MTGRREELAFFPGLDYKTNLPQWEIPNWRCTYRRGSPEAESMEPVSAGLFLAREGAQNRK
jgi:hypothetical protein